MDWWYSNKGQKCGPVSEEQVRTLIRSGSINADTLVWHAGEANWTPARTSPLNEYFIVPPPLPTQNTQPSSSRKLNNTFAWLLAIAPAIFTILGFFYLFEFFITRDLETLYYLIIVATNLILLACDFAQISDAGYRLNKWFKCIMAFLICYVPLYLFVRAYKTDKRYLVAFVGLGVNLLVLFIS